MSTRSFLIGFAIFQIFNLTIHAQTSGATAPEVTQFEPVDTTDLVNLATGDFTYSIPAIVIPGAPGGGYPIALSYHAGILTNQEASWVGLGWNLSPGAVARAVRGYPDDFRGEGTITTTTFDTIYGYSVGFGWDTWSAGIKWDNHGGFGGEISVGFKESGVGVSASYYKTGDGKTSYGVGVNYGTGPASFSMEYQSGGGFGVGASYKTGDFSWGLNYSNGSGVGISASGNSELNGVSHSNSNLGFSLRSGFSYKLKMGPNFVASSSTHGFGAVTTTSTTQAELNFLFFSLGTSKTNIVARSHTAAYGYLYMDEVGKSIDGTTLIEPYYNSSSDKNIDVSSLSSSELTAFLDKLQNNKKVMDKTFANSINSIGYDFYFQDFGSKYQELAAGEGYQYVATYSSDYMAPTYDLYTFSGQGMSGMARPIYGNLGFVVPTDPIVTKKVKNTDFYFYPYRNLYWAMAKGESGLGTNYENYFGHALTEDEHYGFWKKPEKSINMIFIDDPGLVDDFHFFEDSGNPIDRKNLLNRLRNRSKRVSYETDQYGKIEKITATKADGVCYVYGVIRNVETGAVTAGADPRVLDQAKVVQTKDDLNSASVGDQTSQYTPSDFAYSWNLAAVLSPDYLDNPPLGSIGPEDFGSYITFHYDLANPSYHYSNPLNSSDFEFIGKESNETKYYFEKTYGTKELYYLREAKTRSHTALFDQNYESDLRADSIAANNIDRMIFKKGNQFSVAVDVVPEIINDPQFQANILPYNGLFNEIIAVRKGLAQYTELPLFGSISTQYQCNLISYPINLRYVGTALNADYDLFLVEWPSGAGGCVTPLNEFSIGITSSARKLNDIRLVKNAKLNILKGESLVYSVNTINDNSDNARLYQAKVKFNYSYDLAKDTPNTISSVNPNGGRLTLQGIKYFASGNFLANPGYSFEYFNDATLGYGHDKHDPWGYYSRISTQLNSRVDPSIRSDEWPIQALWSLKEIHTDLGATIKIDYESDRFSFVQDRLYPPKTLPNTLKALTATEVSGLLYDGVDPSSVTDIISKLGLLGFNFGSNEYNGQVVVECLYRSSQKLYSSPNPKMRFVLPTKNNGGSFGFKPNHPSLDELARWLWHEENYVDGAVLSFEILAFDYVDGQFVQNFYSSDNQVGELGGGLRVRRIESSPEVLFTGQTENQIIEYSYLDPDTQLDSGSIFSEPVKYKSGLVGDTRIIRTETKPYLGLSNSGVVYEKVKVSRVDGKTTQIVPGETEYSFFSNREPNFLYPFDPVGKTGEIFQGTGENITENNVFQADASHPMFQWKPIDDPDDMWEVKTFFPKFTLKNDTRYKIINNSNIVGQVKQIQTLDKSNRVISSTKKMYATNYSPFSDPLDPIAKISPLVKKFHYDQASSSIVEDIIDNNRPSQGVTFSKTQGILLGSNKNGDDIVAKILLIDEVENVFRETGTEVTEFQYPDSISNQFSQKVVNSDLILAHDYWTGMPILNRKIHYNSNGSQEQSLALSITAHQIYGNLMEEREDHEFSEVMGDLYGNSQGLYVRNMLTQTGLVVGFNLVKDPGNPVEFDPTGPIIDGINALISNGQGSINSAQFSHYRKPFSDPNLAHVYIHDASFGFISDSTTHNSLQWNHINLQQSSANISLKDSTPNDGEWIAAGQNTEYDRFLHVLEYIGLDGTYSSAIYSEDGIHVMATFSNTELGQCYFQGFEDFDSNASGIFSSLSDFEDGQLLSNGGPCLPDTYLDNFEFVYSGTQSFFGSSFQIQKDFLTKSASDSRNEVWVSFVSKGGSPTVNNLGFHSAPYFSADEEVLGLYGGWTLYRKKIPKPAINSYIQITSPSPIYLDDIVVYPAANNSKTSGSSVMFGYHPENDLVTSITDERGRTVRFEYDERGQLFRTYDIDGHLRSENYKSYQGEPLKGVTSPAAQ